VNTGDRIPFLGFDDINAHLPRSLYFTHRGQWQELSKNWNLSRAMVSCFVHTSPIKDDIASFILKDMDTEVHCYARQGGGDGGDTGTYEVYRWVEDINVDNPFKTVHYPIQVRAAEEFRADEVPKEEWDVYWKEKMKVTKIGVVGWAQGMKELGKTFSEIERRISRGALAPVQ
jgi:hypothetical protein